MRVLQLHFAAVILMISSFVLALPANAQDQAGLEQGLKPYGAFNGGDIDSISMVNGSLNLHIPLVSYSQRGGKLPLGFTVIYNNPVYQEQDDCNGAPNCIPTRFYWYVNYSGARAINIVPDFYPAVTSSLLNQAIQYYSVKDPDGTLHQMGQTGTYNWISMDATGYAYDSNLNVLTDRQGTRYTQFMVNGSPSGAVSQIEDTNGNLITAQLQSSGNPINWTDTLGRSIPNPFAQTTTDFSGCAGTYPTTSAYLWTPPGPSGSTSQFKFCLAHFPLSNYPVGGCGSNCSGLSGSTSEIQSIVLPNGTAWTFELNNEGALSTITFPTGGTISYTWNSTSTCLGPNPPRVDSENVRAAASRAVNSNDGTGSHTWTYAQTWSTSGVQTIVTDPNLNDAVHTESAFSGGGCTVYESELDQYSGSHSGGTLLKKTATTYNYSTDPYTSGLYINVLPLTTTVTDVPSGKVSKSTRTYDSGIAMTGRGAGINALYGNLASQIVYDYGSGAAGLLLRQTQSTYMALSSPNAATYLANNLLSLPYTIQVLDGGGQRAYTTYGYDEYPLVASGFGTQHDANPLAGTYRGNSTSVSRWLNAGGGNPIETNTYFDTGMVSVAKDPKSNSTTYAYSSNYQGAYPTTITNALNQSTVIVYDFNTGLVTSTTDPNSQTTSYSYDSMSRLYQISRPDGALDTLTHQESTFPVIATLTSAINSSLNRIESNVFDGLGRVSQHQITSDPDGATFTAITHDALGRPSTVSNATRCNPPTTNCGESTWGVTSTVYDALNRACVIVPPDGTSAGNNCPSSQPANDVFSVYSGNTTTVTDQAGNIRKSFDDALGRLIEVDEPGVGGVSAVAGSGSASVGGSEQSNGGTPATSGTGSVTFSGTVQSRPKNTTATATVQVTQPYGGDNKRYTCPKPGVCWYVYDSGTVTITVNGTNYQSTYGQGSTNLTVASGLTNLLNAGSLVSASYDSTGKITATAKQTGSCCNYSLSTTSQTTNTSYFSGTSFPAAPSGSSLTGGTSTNIYDSGTSTITVNGHTDTASWSGSGTTSSSIASTLVSNINSDSAASVTASASGPTVSLTSKQTGAGTNYVLSSSSTYDSSNFSGPSFASSNSGSSLTGGINGTATIYDTGIVWIKVAGFQATASYGQSDTTSSIVTNLANALNGPGSPVTASPSGAAVSLTAKAAGGNTNFTLSAGSSTNQPSNFTQPSFRISTSGTTLTGGSSPTLSFSTPAVTTYNYDALDDLIGVTQSGSRQRSFTYDSLSRLVCASNPESSSASCPTTAGSYTPGTTGYTYDANGYLITKTAPAPNRPDTATVTTTYSYDALNRVTQKSYSDATPTVIYGYDAVAPSGCTLPALTIHNGIGKRTGMCDSAGAEAWSYDIVAGTGWKITDARTTRGVALTAVVQSNFDGSIKTISYPSGHTVMFARGGAARPLSATDTTASISYVSNAHYWPSSAIAALTSGATISYTAILNSRLQPCWTYGTTGNALPWTSTACGGTSTTGNILDLKYNYNLGSADNGNVAGITNNRDTTRSQTFTYDQLGRLTKAQTTSTYSTSTSNCWGEAFAFDAWGNFLSVSEASPSYDGCIYETPQAWTLNAKNQIQSTATCFDSSGNLLTVASFCYDAPGNLLTDTARSYSYDAENRLKSIPILGISYLYDGDGRRVAKLDSSGQATKLYWYGLSSDPLDETDGAGANNNASFFEYVFFNGERVARRDASNTVSYYFVDHLGTARVVTNPSGTILDDSDFYPFGGERAVTSSSGNAFKFTGKERDSESGLDNFGARYMSSSMGRFVSADPITVTPGRVVDPQQLNLYSYVRNNPLRLVDPTGMLIDDSQLSDKDKKKWQKIQDLANKKDKDGNYVNKKLHDVFDRLQSDNRTFTLENSKLGAGTAGKFTITEMSGNDFTKATLQLDFKQISSISSTTPADQVPGFNKFEGIVGNKTLELAETFGHEGAHGVFALDNTTEEVGLQGLLNQQDAALKSGNFPLPPDVMQKINDGLARTEKFAQQTEKIINGELQAKENKKP